MAEHDVTAYEKELAGYLQERIRPGLNRGSIPLLARSIAKEIAQRDQPNGTPKDADPDEEPNAEAEDETAAEDEDEDDVEEQDDDVEDEDKLSAEEEDEADDEEPTAFENEMYELQAELGDDWIVRFSVQGDDGWLTAEKDDGSQRIEAPVADVLREAVALLNEGGGRST